MTRKTRKKPVSKRKPTSLKKYALFLLVLLFAALVSWASISVYQMLNPSVAPQHMEDGSSDALMEKMRAMLEQERQRLNEKPLPSYDFSSPKPPVQTLPPEPQKPEPVEPSMYENGNGQKPSEVLDYEKSLQKSPKTVVFEKKKPVAFTGKPKLAIIIDDVSFAHHARKIKEIPFKITPSILPPTSRHPDSHTLAKEFAFYMVHLPLEALSHNAPEEKTLKVGDSEEEMHAWIVELKRLFPKAVYYNNHTGSRFTAHLGSMEKLIRVLKKEGLIFLDSRTTPHAKSPELAKKYGMVIHSRDVFLDNSYDKESIQAQLREAVRLAKRNGQAIAIGHPHANTLSVLAEAQSILGDVEVVYVNEL